MKKAISCLALAAACFGLSGCVIYDDVVVVHRPRPRPVVVVEDPYPTAVVIERREHRRPVIIERDRHRGGPVVVETHGRRGGPVIVERDGRRGHRGKWVEGHWRRDHGRKVWVDAHLE